MVESSGSTSHAQFQLVVTQALKKTRHENDLPLLKKLKLNAMYLAKTTSTNISDNKTKENLLSLISQLDEAIVDIYNQKNVKVSSDETNDHASTQNKDHTDKEYDFVTTVQQKITTGNSSSTTSALKLQTLIKKQKVLCNS